MQGERYVRGSVPQPDQIVSHYGDDWQIIFVDPLPHGDYRLRVRDDEGNKSWITIERALDA